MDLQSSVTARLFVDAIPASIMRMRLATPMLMAALLGAPAIVAAQPAVDVDGYRLGMPFAEVSKRIKLTQLGVGEYEAKVGDSTYDFGFTPLGRLYRLGKTQKLPPFVADAKFAQALTARMVAKYGRPESNTLPGGLVTWRITTGLDVHPEALKLHGPATITAYAHDGQDAELVVKMMGLAIRSTDFVTINRGPGKRAADAATF